MEDDILTEIIKVEKEIKERIEVERRLARERIEKAKEELEKEVESEEERLKESINKVIEEAQLSAHEEAKRIIDNALMDAKRFKEISDNTLRGIVIKYIKNILPKI